MADLQDTGGRERCGESNGIIRNRPYRRTGRHFTPEMLEQLSEVLNKEKLPGVITTPVWFIPSTSKFEGVNCAGVVFHVTDSKVFDPVTLGIVLLDTMRKLYGEKFQLLPPISEDKKPMLALLSGGGELLGDWDKDKLLASYEADSARFVRKKEKYHLYE